MLPMPEVASLTVEARSIAPRTIALAPGLSSEADGAVASILTVAVRSDSVTPARFVERYVIVCVPSFEPSDGAGTVTVVPLCHEPVSTLNCVPWTPDSASASSVVAGGVLSTTSVRSALVVLLPARSSTFTRTSQAPSAGVQVEGAPIAVHVYAPLGERSNVVFDVSMPEPA